MNEMKTVLLMVYMIEIILCQINLCSYKNVEIIIINRNHGLFSKTQNKCICNDGYTEYDCSDRVCLSGYKFSNDGSMSECSDRGRCNRETGLCECLVGYTGDSCENHICPMVDGVVCGGHGVCVNEYDYEVNHMRECKINGVIKCEERKIEDLNPPIEAKYLKRNNICICESGYSGFDCSIKDCPYGLAGSVDNKKDYYGTTTDISTPPPDPINPPDPKIASFDIVTIPNPISEYLDLEIVRCDEKIDSSEIPCRYEIIRLYPTDGKNEIRTKLKKSGIIHDVSVQLFDTSSSKQVATLSDANTMVLYYILDPFTYTIASDSLTVAHHLNEATDLKLQQCSGYGYCDNGECKSHAIDTTNPRIRRRELQGTDLCEANDPYLGNYGITAKNCQLDGSTTISGDIVCPDGSKDSTTTGGNPCKCDSDSYEVVDGICRKRCDVGNNGMECNGNGKCKISGNDVECECGVGYSGKACETSTITYFPGESPEETRECNGNGVVIDQTTHECECYIGYRGVTCSEKICPIGPVLKDYRCESVGDPPQITFKDFKSGDTIKVKLNGREIIENYEISTTTPSISYFISTLSDKGVKGEIVCISSGGGECGENDLSKPITTEFTLQFFYYCKDELNPTDDKGERGLAFFYGTNEKIIKSEVDGITILGDGSSPILEYTTGTIECEECSNQGKCKEGICECNKNYGSSNGWNKNRKTIDIGDRGDCSYFFDYIPQT